MTTLLSKTAAAKLTLTAKLAAHLSTDTATVSKAKLVRWVLSSELDNRRRFTDKQRRLLEKRDGGKCFYCGAHAGDDWQADHVLPWSLGGQTVLKNGVVACASCNCAKSNKVW